MIETLNPLEMENEAMSKKIIEVNANVLRCSKENFSLLIYNTEMERTIKNKDGELSTFGI